MIWFKVAWRVLVKFYENTYVLWNWLGCSAITYAVILLITQTPFWGHNSIYADFRYTAIGCSCALGIFVYGIVFFISSEIAAPARVWVLKIKKEIEAEEHEIRRKRELKSVSERERLKGTNLKVVKPLSEVE